MNCCLFDVDEPCLSGGFEMGNIWYNEPKTLDVAFDVIGDIVLSAASQQYGGFTVPSVEEILAPYAEKSYEKYIEKYHATWASIEEKAKEVAWSDVQTRHGTGIPGLGVQVQLRLLQPRRLPVYHHDGGHGHKPLRKDGYHHHAECAQGRPGQRRATRSRCCSRRLCSSTTRTSTGRASELEDVFEAGIDCSSQDHVSGLAVPDRQGVYRQHVQTVR